MSTVDWNEGSNPGADLYSWESQWASIEAEDADDPDAAVSQYADLVERVLEGSGYAIHDPVARQGEEREIVATYLSARQTAERAELGEASRAEVKAAIEDLRAIFDSLTEPGSS
ncbi:MAG TPA: hypothetical protein VFV56_12105 [Gaiellaceae bacterium]|nr:hypothetical protein [Gaiellaceae bacterium]